MYIKRVFIIIIYLMRCSAKSRPRRARVLAYCRRPVVAVIRPANVVIVMILTSSLRTTTIRHPRTAKSVGMAQRVRIITTIMRRAAGGPAIKEYAVEITIYLLQSYIHNGTRFATMYDDGTAESTGGTRAEDKF